MPSAETALAEPNGLVAVGGGLSVPRLLDAYRRGIFPWFDDGDPVLWWSPDPRMVLYVREVHVARSLHKVLKSDRFRVTLDAAFPAVVRFSGLSFSYNVAYAICGGVTPVLVTLALRDNPLAPAHYLAAMGVAGVLLGTWAARRGSRPEGPHRAG